MSDEEHDKLLRHAVTVSRELGIDKTLKEYGVDVIIAPADSAFNLLVSSAGMFLIEIPFRMVQCIDSVTRLPLGNNATIVSRLQWQTLRPSCLH